MGEKASAKTAIVNYESPTAAYSRNMAIVATACFIVFFPLPIVFVMVLSKMVSWGITEGILLLVSICSLAFFLLAFNAYRANRNTRLILTDVGIVVPSLSGMPSRESVPWGKVEKIEVTGTGALTDKDAMIVFTMQARNNIKLRLSTLKHEDLDKLVSACELWANRWAKDETFLKLVEQVTHKRRDSDDSSFTALWMEEAQRRLSTTPFTPLDPGRQLQEGRVKVVQPLTAGGWSAIYLCHFQERTPAILKEAVVPPSSKEELKKKAYEHFEREAVLLAGVDHPQVAKVLDYFIENGRQYMVLQRISGANLRSYIRDKGAASERQAMKWATELAQIIKYLHAQEPPIVHRDLTPENMILDMKGSLVLIDFGSANEFVGTVTGTLVGKPSYISPEQFSGHAKLQSDLYALGAVIYFMTVGKDPEPLAVASPKADNPAVSEGLDALVKELMQLDASKRIQDVGIVLERLDGLNKALASELI